MLAIALAAITVGATFIGGVVALKSKDRFHLILGLAAGLLLGLVAFDLLPEVFAEASLMVNGKIGLKKFSRHLRRHWCVTTLKAITI